MHARSLWLKCLNPWLIATFLCVLSARAVTTNELERFGSEDSPLARIYKLNYNFQRLQNLATSRVYTATSGVTAAESGQVATNVAGASTAAEAATRSAADVALSNAVASAVASNSAERADRIAADAALSNALAGVGSGDMTKADYDDVESATGIVRTARNAFGLWTGDGGAFYALPNILGQGGKVLALNGDSTGFEWILAAGRHLGATAGWVTAPAGSYGLTNDLVTVDSEGNFYAIWVGTLKDVDGLNFLMAADRSLVANDGATETVRFGGNVELHAAPGGDGINGSSILIAAGDAPAGNQEGGNVTIRIGENVEADPGDSDNGSLSLIFPKGTSHFWLSTNSADSQISLPTEDVQYIKPGGTTGTLHFVKGFYVGKTP